MVFMIDLGGIDTDIAHMPPSCKMMVSPSATHLALTHSIQHHWPPQGSKDQHNQANAASDAL
jgi:hypothetical protein